MIVASPLTYRQNWRKPGGLTKFFGTKSDHVGIRGILQTFGSIYGFMVLPDLIDPENYYEKVLQETRMNIYCIGSPKSNQWTQILP